MSTACGFLLQCPMFVFTAWAIELTTGAGYLGWINQFQYDPRDAFCCRKAKHCATAEKTAKGQAHLPNCGVTVPRLPGKEALHGWIGSAKTSLA